MINNDMLRLGKKSSVIREIFEYGKKRKAEIGEENVFDFSLGNPSIPAPECVTEKMLDIIKNTDSVALHGYTSAPGDITVRRAVAESIKERFDFPSYPELIYMTCGAAASLTVSLKAIVNCGDEVIVLAPFFPEYRVFAENAGAKVVTVKCRESDFQIDFEALEKAVTEKTKAIIVNSPNNPTGAVLSEDTVKKLAKLLSDKCRQYSNDIFIIAD